MGVRIVIEPITNRELYKKLRASYYDTTPQCCPEVIDLLDDDEREIVNILYWLRNRHKDAPRGTGLKAAMRTQTYAGPKGVYDKKGRWKATGLEACDHEFYAHLAIVCGDTRYDTDIHPADSEKYDHFAARNHCRTKQHLAFLVKYRLGFVCHRLVNAASLALMVGAIQKDEVPLLVNDDDPLIQDFVNDFLSGKFFSPRGDSEA